MNDLMEIFNELDLGGMGMEILMTIGVIALVLFLIYGILSLAMYILKAAGVYTIAKRRGINHAWLAWIPYADYWVVGSISDQYKHTVKGKSSSNRIILLILALAGGVVSLISGGVSLGASAEILESILDQDLESLIYAVTMTSGGSGVIGLLMDGLNLALLVFWQIALYDVYSSCCPQYNVLYLVLGIIFPFTIPFYLFFNRKKDEGMRIPQAPVEPAAYIPQENGPDTEYL